MGGLICNGQDFGGHQVSKCDADQDADKAKSRFARTNSPSSSGKQPALGMSRLCSATFEQLFAFEATFFGSSNFKQLFPF
jgi:hypothetical protein